jgi:3-phosphoshikimate 1-carboxyvinyltransferase
VGELRVKECDRLAAIIEGLAALGVHAWATGDDLHIEGGGLITNLSYHASSIDSHNDHRLAMTWAVAAYALGVDMRIIGAENIAVSYPSFITSLEGLL